MAESKLRELSMDFSVDKKQAKQVIGLNFYIELTISMNNSIKLCRTNVRQFVLC